MRSDPQTLELSDRRFDFSQLRHWGVAEIMMILASTVAKRNADLKKC